MGGNHSNQRVASASSGGEPEPGGIPRSERRVLIAVDGSHGSQRAFDYWCSQKGSEADSIILVNSLETPNVLSGLLLSPSGTFDYAEYEKHTRQLRQRSQELEQHLLGQCRQRRLHCKFVSKVGDPGASIVEAAKANAANLVVVGCRGNNGIRRTILGSVSDYVLQHSSRPVIVVPDTPGH